MVFGLQATNRDRELICTNLAKRNDRIFEQHIQTEIYGKERRKILWRMIRLACETKLFDAKLHWIFLIVTQEILFNGNLLTLLPNNFTRSFARNSPIISFGRKTIRLYAARISQRFQEKKPFYDISVTGH